MDSTYPDHDPEPLDWQEDGGRSILKPRGLFIRWGRDDKYWRLPDPTNPDGAAELLKVGYIEVSAKKDIDLEKTYQIGFRVSLSQSWNPRYPVFIMAKKQDGNYIARKETFRNRPKNGEEFDIPDNFVIKFPPGDHRLSSKSILHMTLCDQWTNVNWKQGLHIHYAFVKEQTNEVQPDRLTGDLEDVTYNDDQGFIRCSAHHDDCEDINWNDDDGVERERSVVYRDAVRAAPVPDVPWLLMEPVSHGVRRRRWWRSRGWCSRGWGSPITIATEWGMAPVQVKELLFGTPFGIFLDALPSRVSRDAGLATALAARWWDTTHTFHWSWGEMTMTPLDLFALTGIASGGAPIVINKPLRLSEADIVCSLGWFPRKCGPGDSIPRETLFARLAMERARVLAADGHMTRQAARQYARILLLLTCHDLFESRGGDTVHFWWLRYFRKFDDMYNYDWGGFILAVLYDGMDQVSRHMAGYLKGFSMLWASWFVAYTRRRLGQVDLIRDDPDQIPFIRRFITMNYKSPYVYRVFNTATAAVVGLLEEQVEWAPWVGCEALFGYAHALTASRTRRLIRDEYGALFYLGERVVRQHTPEVWPRVPTHPHPLMRKTTEIPDAEVQVLLDGLGFLNLTHDGDYSEFAERYLMREPKGVRGRVVYDRYRALGGDPTYIRGQLYLSRNVSGHLPPHPNLKEMIVDSDDEDPDGEREAPLAGGDGGPEGGDGGGAVTIQELANMVGEEVRVDFPKRSWGIADFFYDLGQFGKTRPAGVTTTPSVAPPLRETDIADPPGVRVPVIRLSAPSPGLDTSSSRPPLVPTREGGSSTSAVAPADPSISIPLIIPPPIPREIWYTSAGLRQYKIPDIPLPDDTFNFLGDRLDDEIIGMRVSDVRSVYASSLYNWNLLRYLGRDPLSYDEEYRRVVEAFLPVGDFVATFISPWDYEDLG